MLKNGGNGVESKDEWAIMMDSCVPCPKYSASSRTVGHAKIVETERELVVAGRRISHCHENTRKTSNYGQREPSSLRNSLIAP